MRYVRPLFIGILSFVIALNAAAIRAIVAIFLCSLLGICFSASTDFSVLSHTNSAQASISFGLEGQEVAVPPIIREAPIDLQNSLADDFIVSRQTPFDSGRNEVLIISPSTGTEQRFEISLPTGNDFQLYQASFSKVRVGDVSEIVDSSDSRDAKSMLDSFSISFNRSYIASEITLADGSQVEFSSSEASVYTADGVQVETISLSSEDSLNETYISTLKSHDKSIEYLLSQASSCESGIRNQIYAAGQDIGRKSGVLRGAMSPQGKAASWASAFGERALEDSLVSETRNQTLQEIACVPPIECDEEQSYEGASEVRTDLFKIPGNAYQQVDVKYQFYKIPDRMEIYYQGELVDSIPRGGGQTSGSSQLSVQLPGGADFVGVKLIGNEDEDTRWTYTISCSAECEEIDIDREIADDAAQLERANEEWAYIRDVIGRYYEENINNPAAAAFSEQMYNLAAGSFVNRTEVGGWAGEFTRNTLLIAARDIGTNRDFWDSPPPVPPTTASWRNSQVGWIFARACNTIEDIDVGIDPYNNSDRAYDCGFGRAGEHHLNRHLKPAFNQGIRSRLLGVIENECIEQQELGRELELAMRELKQEHSLLLDSVLVPAVSTLPITSLVGWPASWNVPRIAKDLRDDILGEVLDDYVREGKIPEEIAKKLK